MVEYLKQYKQYTSEEEEEFSYNILLQTVMTECYVHTMSLQT